MSTAAAAEGPTIARPDTTDSTNLIVSERILALLEGRPSTGSTWKLAPEPDCVDLIGPPEYVPRSDFIGETNHLVSAFEAADSGFDRLKFAYHRPWESRPPLSVPTFKVTVRP